MNTHQTATIVNSEQNNNLERKLITIASGKGGVGKTWVSTSLAHALAHLGKKTLLFDGDFGLANVDIQLGIVPAKDLGNYISCDASLSEIITRYTDSSGYGFDVLPGKSGSGALGSLSRELLLRLKSGLTALAASQDYVVLDLAAGIDPSVTTLSSHQGLIIVVMTSDPTSLTDAYAFIKLTRMRNPAANIKIVVNNVDNKRDGNRAYEAIKKACEGFLKISPPLLGMIKQDAKVVDAIRSQMPILTRHPYSEASHNIKNLAAAIIEG